MAQIILNIPDGSLTRILDGIAGLYGYVDIIDGQANPESKGAFVKRMIIERIKNDVKKHEFVSQNEQYQSEQRTRIATLESEINNISVT